MKPAPPVTRNRWRAPISGTVTSGRSPLRILRLAAVPVVTVALLFYFLRRLPPGTIADSYRHASPLPLAISAVAIAVFMLARALRYRMLLAAGAHPRERGPQGRSLGTGQTLAVTVAAWWPGLLLPGIAATTLLARAATAVQYTALFAALGQSVTVWQAWFALSFRTLLLAIPVQGVAGLGTTQLWWTAALTVMGWPARLAERVGFQIHLLDLSVTVPLSLIGGAVLLLIYWSNKTT